MHAPKAATSTPMPRAREALLLAGDDDHEQDARDREVAEAVEERAGAQERPAPEKAESLHDLRSQTGGVDLTLLLERRPHQREREERERVGDGVEDERHGTAEREERPAERRPGEHHRRAARPDDAHGCRQLLPRHDGAERSGVSGVEEDGARALDEGDDHDLPERHAVEEDRRGQSRDRERSHPVGRDHQPLAVPAVGRDACRQAEEAVREEPGEADDPGLRRRVGDREDEQRIRDRGHLRAERREQPPAQQQHEIPVPPQRGRRCQRSRCCWRSARSTYPSGTLPTEVQPPST